MYTLSTLKECLKNQVTNNAWAKAEQSETPCITSNCSKQFHCLAISSFHHQQRS